MTRKKVKNTDNELLAFTICIPKKVVVDYVSEKVICGAYMIGSEKSVAEKYIDHAVQEALRNYYFKAMMRVEEFKELGKSTDSGGGI